jgi:hypothetical protein
MMAMMMPWCWNINRARVWGPYDMMMAVMMMVQARSGMNGG